MNRSWILFMITAVLIGGNLSPNTSLAASSKDICATKKGVRVFPTRLQPGVWQSFRLGASAHSGVYFVDFNPLKQSIDGAYIQHVILPEFDGTEWVDTLNVWLPAEAPPLKTLISVRCGSDFPQYFETETRLQPGVWHGFAIQNAQEDGAFVPEVTPLEPSVAGATLEDYVVQPEYNTVEWLDVFRVMIPSSDPPLEVNLRLWGVHDVLPVFTEFEETLQPGTWHGWVMAPSSERWDYVVDVTPLDPSGDGAHIERYLVQPEFNGSVWYDVLRVMSPANYPPMRVNIKVYVVQVR